VRFVTVIITGFIESEFRSANLMAQDALSAMQNGNVSDARERIRKARLCFVVAMVHLRDGQADNGTAFPEADTLDDRLREIELLIELTC
jgi:hypothetical protein